MKKLLVVAFTALLELSNMFSAPLKIENLVNEKVLATLKENGSIVAIHSDKNIDKVMAAPSGAYKEKIKNLRIEKPNSGFYAEILYYIPKSELLKNSEKKEITIQDVSVVMRSISKMEGMKYHFAEKKNGEVLYETAYMIDNPKSKKRIDDQNYGSADGQVSYCLQRDHTFGKNIYRLEYFQNENEVLGTFLNEDGMGLLGFDAVKAHNLRIIINAFDCGDSILLYLSTDVNYKGIPLYNMRNKIKDSMLERMDAVFRWFKVQF